ncbi:MAG TPA: hypothetical protein VMD49_01795 [Steroidobacteraceae bacterium]|nr:hypothetical protein [Steroidobacteraceae bacterium]
MGELSELLNLARSMGVDADLEDSAAWNRVGLPAAERLWPLSAGGCIFAAAADEWVPVRFPIPRRHWL